MKISTVKLHVEGSKMCEVIFWFPGLLFLVTQGLKYLA